MVGDESSTDTRDWLWGLVLILAVIVAYSPVWWADYVWDDDVHLTANPCIVGPYGLKEIWTTAEADVCPFTITTFWAEHKLWGLAPLPYHVVNVLLHGACAVLLWRVLRSLSVKGAWLGAALWALHPVQVESVAWITEMKNTESGVFFLLSILFFLKHLSGQSREQAREKNWNYPITLLFAALAMASKSSTVILPLVLCLCAWWVEGRWKWRSLVEMIPVFLLSVATGLASMWAVQHRNADANALWVLSWPQRFLTAGDAVWFYLGKLLWPFPLMAIYPRWYIDVAAWFSCVPLLALIAVFSVLWVKRQSWPRYWFFALSYFVVALLPVLGLIQHTFMNFTLVANHFQYLASMGPLALAGAGLVVLTNYVSSGRSWAPLIPATGILLALGILSWQRSWAYESDEILWADTLAKNPNCWNGYNNIGNDLIKKGQLDAAETQFHKSLEINPNNAEALINLGNVLLLKKQVEEAIDFYEKALELHQQNSALHKSLGLAFAQAGRFDRAIGQFQEALDINPNTVGARNYLGLALAHEGRMAEAIAQFQQVVAGTPSSAEAHNNLGRALLQNGQANQAIPQFQQAIQLKPDFGDARNNLEKAEEMTR